LFLLVALALVLSVSGCGAKTAEKPAAPAGDAAQGSAQEETPAQSATGAGGETLYTPTYKPNGKETATFKTSKGDIVVELYGNDAPITVGSFIELAKKGFYDKTRFHRYEPGFVIQGGDPQSKGLSADAVQAAVQSGNPPLGTGGPGYTIKGEFGDANPNKHVEGALGLARSQSPDSGGSQFYFTLAATPFLDGNYAVFGKVTKGLDVVKELRVGDEIESVIIQGAE
jgi:peptidyl-prolyl cis-trans isomerase B (cyclophilin B)